MKILDVRLGGKKNHGTKYRDAKTGQFTSAPKCPPHYWYITNENGKEVGRCKKCRAVKVFRKEVLENQHYRYYPQPKPRRYVEEPDPAMENAIKILER